MKSRLNFTIKHVDGRTYDMHEQGLWVESFHILSPNPERTTQRINGVDGARLKKSRMGVRKVIISIQVDSENIVDFDALKHRIFYMFYSEQPFEIVRDFKPNRKILAIQEMEFDINNITQSDGEFSLELTMYDPFLLGETHDLEISNVFNTFEIKGQKRAPWISYTLFSSSRSSYTIENNEGGKIVINFNFISGDVLEIDYKKRKVTLNGEKIAVSFSSHWFDLRPGYLLIKASQDTTLTYTERWL